MWEVKSLHSEKWKAFFTVQFAAIMSKGNSEKSYIKKHQVVFVQCKLFYLIMTNMSSKLPMFRKLTLVNISCDTVLTCLLTQSSVFVDLKFFNHWNIFLQFILKSFQTLGNLLGLCEEFPYTLHSSSLLVNICLFFLFTHTHYFFLNQLRINCRHDASCLLNISV